MIQFPEIMAVTGQAAPNRKQTAEPLPYAGFSLRVVAFILDVMVTASMFALFVAFAGLQILLRTDWGDTTSDGANWTGLAITLSFLLFLPWYFIATWWWKGQTLGMMAVHIAVTDRDGNHLSFLQAFLRTLVYPLSFLPLCTGFATIWFDRESRALHDMLASTVVVELP
ncbi:MAG: RDD family protein [Chloroflexi bacterium]|nr:RDD family protein [Chloroflexota bacterium]